VGGWRGTLGTYDLKSRSKGSRGKSDGTCLGEKRCSREAIDLTNRTLFASGGRCFWWDAHFM